MLILDFIRGWWSCFTLYGGGKGASAPPPPDYRGAASEQAAASKEIATQTTWANRPTLNTPWGQQTWQAAAGTDPSTGQAITNWTSNINLTPEQQQALDAQQRIEAGRSAAAETLLGQATGAFQSPFRWDQMPGVKALPGQAAQAGNVAAAQQGAFGKMSAMLEPARAQREQALETQLTNMGLPRGSEAWNRAKAQMSSENAAQDEKLLAQALQEGRLDVGQQYGMDQSQVAQGMGLSAASVQQRQQAIAEEAARRGMSLNELNALLTGQQVGMPQMPSFNQATQAQAPNYLGAAVAQGNYNLDAFKANQSGGDDWGSAIGGIASVAGTFM